MNDANDSNRPADETARSEKPMRPLGQLIARSMTRRSAMGILGGSSAAVIASGCGDPNDATLQIESVEQAFHRRKKKGHRITTLVFDAYGTLFDVYLPLFNKAKELYGPGYNDLFYQALIQVWRLKQLENTWLRTLIDEYEDFYSCTLSALDFALKSAGIDPALEPEKRDALGARYLNLDAYPETVEVLTELKALGLQLAILSNGSRDMLQQVVEANALDTVLDAWISTDEVGVFKPHRRVYGLAAPTLRVRQDEILFVSSNSFDVLGAKRFGLQTAWIRRGANLPQIATPAPDAIAPNSIFAVLRARQELEEETTLLPDYVVVPPAGSTEGLRGLLTLAALQG